MIRIKQSRNSISATFFMWKVYLKTGSVYFQIGITDEIQIFNTVLVWFY